MSMPSAAIFWLVTLWQGGQTKDKTGSLSVHLDGLHLGVAALWPCCAYFKTHNCQTKLGQISVLHWNVLAFHGLAASYTRFQILLSKECSDVNLLPYEQCF